MSAQMVILVFTLVIYVLIMMAFSRARKKYTGGKVGDVINLILVTVVLLFIADYVLLLSPVVSPNILEITGAFFRTAGLAFLAFGGIRVAS